MVFKKPYAFFIKMFKPIHILLALLLTYLIYLENLILNFYSQYIYSDTVKVGETFNYLYNNSLYIVPAIIVISFLVIFGIMFQKKKPYAFYLIFSLAFIAIIVVNVYSINFLHTMEDQIIAVKSVKLIHDFTLMTIIIEAACFFVLLIRGMGINIKKFDFNSDLSKIDINDKDREEFEVNVSLNLDAVRKKRRTQIRKIKYLYFENKFVVNIIIAIIVGIVLIISGVFVYEKSNYNREGKEYLVDNYNIFVNNSFVTDSNNKGKKITSKNLVVINLKLKSKYANKELNLKNFTLNIEGAIFKPTKDYYNSFVDIAPGYYNDVLSPEYKNYVIIYEISEKYVENVMTLTYIGEDGRIDIKLNPQKSSVKEKIVSTKKIPEKLSIKEKFGNITFNINDFMIQKEYLIEYDFCISENDCIKSKEYLEPTIDTNFDKKVLRLKIDYKDETSINLVDFYELLLMFGSIDYKIGDTWYSQKSLFEEIKSNKKSDGYTYIGINGEISNSISAKFIFNIRGAKYEYVLW